MNQDEPDTDLPDLLVDESVQEVMSKLKRSETVRAVISTREELQQVLCRVEAICGSFEVSQILNRSTVLECFPELFDSKENTVERIKKRRHLDDIHIFIVDYSEACGQKKQLLEQLSEFLTTSAMSFEDSCCATDISDDDILEMGTAVQDGLTNTRDLVGKLDKLNSSMIRAVYKHVKDKFSTKGRKALENSLQNAKNDIGRVTDTLQRLRNELRQKDERIDELNVQLEAQKTEIDCLKKTAKEQQVPQIQNINVLSTLSAQFSDSILPENNVEAVSSELRIEDAAQDSYSTAGSQKDEDDLEVRNRRRSIRGDSPKRVPQRNKSPKVRERSKALLPQETPAPEPLPPISDDRPGSPHRGRRQSIAVKTIEQKFSAPSVSPGRTDRRKSSDDRRKSSEPPEVNHASPSPLPPPRDTYEAGHLAASDDLYNDSFWSSALTYDGIVFKFDQYRQLAKQKLLDAEAVTSETETKINRKYEDLRKHFHEHKRHWESERNRMVDLVQQAFRMQSEADDDTDLVLKKLENLLEDIQQCWNEDGKATLLLARLDEESGEETERTSNKSPANTGESSAGQSETNLEPINETDVNLHQRRMSYSVYREIISALKKRIRGRRARVSNHPMGVTDLEALLAGETVHDDEEAEQTMMLETISDDDATSWKPGSAKLVEREDTKGATFVTDMPVEEESKISKSRSTSLADHPIALEFLKLCNSVLTFERNVHRLFNLQESEIVAQSNNEGSDKEGDDLEFSRDERLHPQLERFVSSTENRLHRIYLECCSLVGKCPVNFPEFNQSRRNTVEERVNVRDDDNDDVGDDGDDDDYDQCQNDNSDVRYGIENLHEKCAHLQENLSTEQKKNKDASSRNSALVCEMQDTIESLRRELSTLRNTANQLAGGDQGTAKPPVPIMFTRMDMERNTKALRRALNENRLDVSKYTSAVQLMNKYVALPGDRMRHMIKQYLQLVSSVQLEERYGQLSSRHDYSSRETSDTIVKMHTLLDKRALRWNIKSHEYQKLRTELAEKLTNILEEVEQECGMFLIKPIYFKDNRIRRSNLTVTRNERNRNNRNNSYASSNITGCNSPSTKYDSRLCSVQERQEAISTKKSPPPDLVLGTRHSEFWSPRDSNALNSKKAITNHLPRLLEMDINRSLVGQSALSDGMQISEKSNNYIYGCRPSGHISNRTDLSRNPEDGGRKKRSCSLTGGTSSNQERSEETRLLSVSRTSSPGTVAHRTCSPGRVAHRTYTPLPSIDPSSDLWPRTARD